MYANKRSCKPGQHALQTAAWQEPVTVVELTAMFLL